MTYILSKKKPFNWQSKTVYFFMIQTLIFERYTKFLWFRSELLSHIFIWTFYDMNLQHYYDYSILLISTFHLCLSSIILRILYIIHNILMYAFYVFLCYHWYCLRYHQNILMLFCPVIDLICFFDYHNHCH